MQYSKNLITIIEMKISFIFTGKTKSDYIHKAVEEYYKRLKYYVNTDIIVVPDLRNTKKMTRDEQKRKEGEGILKVLPERNLVIALDENGRELSSPRFANFLNKKMIEGRDISMIIGGAYGFSEKVLESADVKISLSKMTFSHQMVRMILLEQVYRAFTILRNEPYHHA
jgi:23S rRNA (pseudouridine1915-N3)-methyltransferase